MADSLAAVGTRVPRCPITNRPSSLAWIKRRARRVAMAHGIPRREAVESAVDDWNAFYPSVSGLVTVH